MCQKCVSCVTLQVKNCFTIYISVKGTCTTLQIISYLYGYIYGSKIDCPAGLKSLLST